MSCNCVKELESKILEKLRKDNPDRRYEDLKFLETGFDQKTWGGGVYFNFTAKYVFTKTNGTLSTVKKHKIAINPTYCPFCGKKNES